MIHVQLRRVLKRRKRSMYWLANEVDSHYPSIYRLAKGRVVLLSIDLLDRICEALDCEISDVLVRVSRKTKKRGK